MSAINRSLLPTKVSEAVVDALVSANNETAPRDATYGKEKSISPEVALRINALVAAISPFEAVAT